VDRSALSVVAQVAGLARDRRAAALDARLLLAEARSQRLDPLVALSTWRRERRFAVERPSAAPVSEALELEAMTHVPALLDSIRAVSAPDGDADSEGGATRPDSAHHASLLAPAAAERLAFGVAGRAPPQAHIVSAVRHFAGALLATARTDADAAARREFAERAVSEESFAAEYAKLAARGGDTSEAARVAVAAAVALRPYAQETPWFEGDPAPTDDDLRREFGIVAVHFDPAVPAAWRPYYRRALGDALRDLRRVVPGMTLDGARIRFRNDGLGGATLAMHDPVSRTIHLPIATAAGTLAHEVAHDLDWQIGRRRYARPGSYGTDVVVREQRGRLAASLRGLTSARLVPPADANAARPPDDVRPAEVFARTLDWFVSMALAREGRVNAYLSAVQDEVLTGHVAVMPHDIGGWSAQALADVLQEMTLVGAPLREWLLAQWGPARVRRPFALAREVLSAPITRGQAARSGGGAWTAAPGDRQASPFQWLDAGGADALGAELLHHMVVGARCDLAGDSKAANARVALARLAAEARARGIVRSRAQRFVDGSRPPWAESALGYGPWSPELSEQVVRRLASLILGRLEESGTMASALDWSDRRAPAHCD
jgi:hypothetical protein